MSEITSKRKLSLTKSTLRVLSSAELGRAAGGGLGVTDGDCHGDGTTFPPTHGPECQPPPPPPPFTHACAFTTFVTVVGVGRLG
jgi:hypothetical protein